MKKVNVHKISTQIKLGQYNRIAIGKNLEDYAIFGLYEKYEDESKFEYEFIIDDRFQSHSYTLIKKIVKDFLSEL